MKLLLCSFVALEGGRRATGATHSEPPRVRAGISTDEARVSYRTRTTELRFAAVLVAES
jgi:hypothetical protein